MNRQEQIYSCITGNMSELFNLSEQSHKGKYVERKVKLNNPQYGVKRNRKKRKDFRIYDKAHSNSNICKCTSMWSKLQNTQKNANHMHV